MKNDDEMYQSVLSRREAYHRARAKRHRTILCIAPVFACFCLAVTLGFSYWNHFRNIPVIPAVPDSTEASAAELPAVTAASGTEESALTESVSAETSAAPETVPAATDETQMQTDATEPEESSGEPAPEDSADASQPEQTVTEQSHPSTQPPTEPTVHPAAQETTGENTGAQEATVAPEREWVFDDPPPHLLYVYARFGEDQHIYQAVGLEAGEKEIGDCLGEAEMFDGWSGTHRLTVKAYLVKERSAEECIAVYFPEEGYYLYQITNEIPDFLQRS